MAGDNGSLQQNPIMGSSLFAATLDPKSLILSQFSNFDDKPQKLQLTTESYFFMERGPRYNDYAALRESKLRMKKKIEQEITNTQEKDEEFSINFTPPPQLPKKQVKFQGILATPPKKPRGHHHSSVLTQSVPDFSSALRKENRKPPPTSTMLPAVAEKSATPPLKSKSGRFESIMGRLGSKSVNSGDKRSGGGLLMGRKSYASLDELKGLASDVRKEINGENRGGGRITRGKTVLGYRQY